MNNITIIQGTDGQYVVHNGSLGKIMIGYKTQIENGCNHELKINSTENICGKCLAPFYGYIQTIVMQNSRKKKRRRICIEEEKNYEN